MLRTSIYLALILLLPAVGAGTPLSSDYALWPTFNPPSPEAIDEAIRDLEKKLQQGGDDEHIRAQDLLVLALLKTQTGDFDEAVAAFTESTRLLRELNDLFGAWLACFFRGLTQTSNGDLAEAAASLEEALLRLEELENPESRLDTRLLLRLSEEFGSPHGFLGLLQPSLQLVRPWLLSFAQAFTHDGLGSVYARGKRFDVAEEHFEQALVISRDQWFALLDPMVLPHLADLRRRQGRLAEATSLLRRALDTGVDGRGLSFLASTGDSFATLQQLAEVEHLRGRHHEALGVNTDAIKEARRLGDDTREVKALLARSRFFDALGRFNEGFVAVRLAHEIAVASGRPRLLADTSIDIGAAQLFRGRYSKAAASFEKSAALYASAGDSYLEAGALLLLAEAYLILESDKLFQETLRRLAKAAEIGEFNEAAQFGRLLGSLGPPAHRPERFEELTPDQFKTLRRLVDWAAADGDQQLTVVLLGQLLSDLASTRKGSRKDEPNVARALVEQRPSEHQGLLDGLTRLHRGRLAQERGNWAEAKIEWERALQRFKAIDQEDFAALTTAALGSLLWRSGDLVGARANYLEAVRYFENTLESVPLEEIFSNFAGGSRRWLYQNLVEILLQNGEAAEAFEIAERGRAQSLLRMLGSQPLRTGRLEPSLAAEGARLRAELRSRKQRRDSGTLAPGSAEETVESLRQKYANFRARLRLLEPEYASLTTVQPVTVAQLQTEVVPPGTTLISYYVTAKRVVAWVVSREAIQWVELDFSFNDLKEIACWNAQVSSRQRNVEVPHPCQAPENMDTVLYERLFAPLVPLINDTRLIVVPHDRLHYLPFVALRNPRTGRYVVEDFTISLAPSAGVLRFLSGKVTPFEGRTLILGNPATDSPPLPAAAREAETIATLFDTAPHLGAQATETRLRENLGSLDLLHVAAHGVYEPAAPLFSRIRLAPDDLNDGDLEVHEIFAEIDLAGVDLVVLSACESGVGKRSGGDDVVGLARSLLFAGSPAIVSTLWPIDDDSSAVLMELFYRHWLAGAPMAEALQAAQKELLYSDEYGAPYYWAAFTLTGLGETANQGRRLEK